MNNINFRAALPSDHVLLSLLFKTVYIETYGTKGITHEFANFIEKQFSPNKIKSKIESDTSTLWIASYSNNPVGIIQIDYNNACPIKNTVFPEINKLYILRNFHGRGIGQNLMNIAEKEIRKKGEDKIWLWVLESNIRANEFYIKQGYKNIGIADYPMEENIYTNNVMLKDL